MLYIFFVVSVLVIQTRLFDIRHNFIIVCYFFLKWVNSFLIQVFFFTSSMCVYILPTSYQHLEASQYLTTGVDSRPDSTKPTHIWKIIFEWVSFILKKSKVEFISINDVWLLCKFSWSCLVLLPCYCILIDSVIFRCYCCLLWHLVFDFSCFPFVVSPLHHISIIHCFVVFGKRRHQWRLMHAFPHT